jgi:hypothetical protein
MPSITDPSYRLPFIVPLRFNEQFTHSANKPILITGLDKETGGKGDYVTKLLGAERMYPDACMRELLASFIAAELDIPVVAPAVVEVTVDFVELLRGNEVWGTANKSIGYNYGSEYVAKFQTLVIGQPIPEKLVQKAMDVFAFDVFIQNSDRSHQKPNMLTDGSVIIILDHELAFGFALELPFSRNKEPWTIRESDKHWITKHCLYNQLKGKIFDKAELGSKFKRLDDAFWNKAWDLIPEPWKNRQQFDEIRSFLSQIVDNSEVFLTNVQLILA